MVSGAAFCGKCGSPIALPETGDAGRWRFRRRLIPVGVGVVVAAALGSAAFAQRGGVDQDPRDREMAALSRQVASFDRKVASLVTRVDALTRASSTPAVKPPPNVSSVAERVLRSVLTIETPDGSGTAWAAWTANGSLYLVTAHHVIEGHVKVKVLRKTSSWDGEVVREDPVNDLAVVRVRKKIAPPLWQATGDDPAPAVGEQLILIGSPYGLEGSVTTGIVSRITYNAIQTDAAANPGNSGGPAVNLQGRVVGVLLAGGGQNVNFAVPTSRLCVTVRRCGTD